MKTTIFLYFSIVAFAIATGWDNRVDYYCQKHVDPMLYAILIDPTTGEVKIKYWDASLLGKQPTIAQLTNTTDAVIDKWIATMNSTNTANVLITPAVQGLMDAYNKKLIAAGLTNCVVTDADVKIATTNRIKKASVKAVQE